MGQIFRKSLLDKLSSPEQLDKMIVITPPSFWIALSGAGIIILSAVLWGIFGSLPVNVSTQGIYVNEEGIQTVYSETAGVVSQVLIGDGLQVKKGDVIAVLDTAEVDEKIADYEKRIKAVENITMDSKEDVVSSDSRDMLEVKNQMITVAQTLNQDQAMLELRTRELAAKKADAATSEAEFLAVEAAYYKSLYTGNNTAEQVYYSDSQSVLSTASGNLDSARSSLDQAQIDYVQAEAQYNLAKNEYNAFMNEHNGSVIASSDELKEKKQQLQQSVEQNRIAMEAAQSTRDSAQASVDKYQRQKAIASVQYEAAKRAYISKTDAVELEQQKQSELGNEYNQAMNQYTSDQSTVTSLADTVDQLTVQVKIDQDNMDNQIEVIYSQFRATKESVLYQLKTECQEYEKKKEQAQIKATVDGKISNLNVTEGSVITQGAEIAMIQRGEGDNRIVVCYVPVASGKKIHEGMEVMVYPSTINKQEYGHMEAEVISVDSYVTSTEDMRRQLGDEKLVETFLSNGSVVEVTCKLRTSENTASGYYWSSRKGASLQISEGTMVEANVVIEKKAPISMLIPYIKEKLTVKSQG